MDRVKLFEEGVEQELKDFLREDSECEGCEVIHRLVVLMSPEDRQTFAFSRMVHVRKPKIGRIDAYIKPDFKPWEFYMDGFGEEVADKD